MIPRKEKYQLRYSLVGLGGEGGGGGLVSPGALLGLVHGYVLLGPIPNNTTKSSTYPSFKTMKNIFYLGLTLLNIFWCMAILGQHILNISHLACSFLESSVYVDKNHPLLK